MPYEYRDDLPLWSEFLTTNQRMLYLCSAGEVFDTRCCNRDKIISNPYFSGVCHILHRKYVGTVVLMLSL
jgi:hypothetical protein